MRLFAACSLLLLASCAPKAPLRAAPPATAVEKFEGPAFTLSQLTVQKKPIVLPASRRPTIQFGPKAGTVSGMAGVNRYSAQAAIEGKDRLRWSGQPVATRMAGPPEAMALEQQFLDALTSATRIGLKGKVLTLQSADGATRLVFTR